MSSTETLLFVYNADRGLFNTLADIGHKLFSPETYPCGLCAITHGVFAERASWKAFIGSLGATTEFLHRDQFHSRFPNVTVALPAIFRLDGGDLNVCVDAEAIRGCAGVDDLQSLILRRCLEPAPEDGERNRPVP
jgi:hypothetical protein